MDIFLVSIPVALVNTIFIMPIDCIKTFYQQFDGHKNDQSFVKTVKTMFKTHGLRGLYLGWSARLIQYMIQSAFTLIVIEDLHKQYRRLKGQN